MSLVDYASSDEDESDVGNEQRKRICNSTGEASISNDIPLPQQPVPANQKPLKSLKQRLGTSVNNPEPSLPKLPDASLLLNSPSMPPNLGGYDHSSRVAAAMAQNASRKRDSKESTSTLPSRGKVPRGNLPHSKGIPDTVGGLLRPPQLNGRSNVVTEDISKLFVNKAEPSSN